jgi:hypothetical protein
VVKYKGKSPIVGLNDNYFIYQKKITWPGAFSIWRQQEKDRTAWQQIHKERGYNYWDEWRQAYTDQLKCDELDWYVFKIKFPTEIIPNFYCGPYKSWRDKHGEGDITTFEKIVSHPDIKNNEGVKKLVSDFPTTTTLIGLRVKNKIAVIEGMHRCCVITLLAENKEPLNSTILIALADYKNRKLPKFKQLTKQSEISP